MYLRNYIFFLALTKSWGTPGMIILFHILLKHLMQSHIITEGKAQRLVQEALPQNIVMRELHINLCIKAL